MKKLLKSALNMPIINQSMPFIVELLLILSVTQMFWEIIECIISSQRKVIIPLNQFTLRDYKFYENWQKDFL